MDAFSYLSVLLSIIIGLAITQILQGYRGLLLARGRVRLYAPTLLFSAVLLVMATQTWWASFGLTDHRGWTFAGFGIVLMQMVLLYMVAALILPDFPPDATIDLRAHYYRERVPFFAIFLVLLATSVLKEIVLEGRPPSPENLAFHGAFGACCVVALATARPRVHLAVAPAIAGISALYIALLFSRL